AGARVVLVPVDEDGDYRPENRIRPPADQRTPLVLPKVASGTYFVVVDVEGYGFHEVYRKVPGREKQLGGFLHDSWEERSDGTIGWSIQVPKKGVEAGMARFCGGEFTMGPDGMPMTHNIAHPCRVAPFSLDTTEVSVGAY